MVVAHLGVAVFIVGVTSVRGYEVERDVKMSPGEIVTIDEYTFRFNGVKEVRGPNYRAAEGNFTLLRRDREIDTLTPQKRIYFAQSQMPMTEASIRSSLIGDVYVSLGEAVDRAGLLQAVRDLDLAGLRAHGPRRLCRDVGSPLSRAGAAR